MILPFLHLTIFLLQTSSPVGSWELHMENGENDFLECADLLKLKSNGEYEVFNSCYGFDVMNPLVEQGKWNLEGDRILLFERALENNYSFIRIDSDEVFLELVSDTVLIYQVEDSELEYLKLPMK